MRIAVFEWLCGGGMFGVDQDHIPDSLRQEGWAMLACASKLLRDAGHQLSTMIDGRLVSPERTRSLAGVQIVSFPENECIEINPCEATLQSWLELASQAEIALIIAPEIDGILPTAIDYFLRHRIPLLNCRKQFLQAASDKWMTAECLKKWGLPHPPTWLASEFSSAWPREATVFCLKPRFGAGCQGTTVGTRTTVLRQIETLVDASQWIVQPMLPGKDFSCSCIASPNGMRHWMPLVSQLIHQRTNEYGLTTLEYGGGFVATSKPATRKLVALLDKTVQALSGAPNEILGWIGIDLLELPDGEWVVIEVNPRLTTSVLGLAESPALDFARRLIDEEPSIGSLVQPNRVKAFDRSDWNPTSFHSWGINATDMPPD